MTVVVLTWLEQLQAVEVGGIRKITALRDGRHVRRGQEPNNWTDEIEGAAAELAVAKTTGRYWHALGKGHTDPADVGRLEVRSTGHAHGCLILHPDDPDEARFVLVTGRIPEFTIRGTIVARDGKIDRYWRTDLRYPAYFVPQAALEPFGLLEAVA